METRARGIVELRGAADTWRARVGVLCCGVLTLHDAAARAPQLLAVDLMAATLAPAGPPLPLSLHARVWRIDT